MSNATILKDIPRLYTVIIPGDGTRSARSRDELMRLLELYDGEGKRYMVAVG